MLQTLALIVLIALAAPAESGEIMTTELRLDDGSRILRQQTIVSASVEEVWAVFTTSDGWESWAVPFAHVDLKIGGIIETSYDPDARRGDAANIHNRILSYLPYRMLSIQAIQAPPDFAYADLLPSLHSVIEFEPLGSDQTQVSIAGVGYGEGERYDQLLDFFRRGNAWTFERLKRRFDEGPLEWTAPPAAADSDSTTTTNNKRKQ